MTVKFLDVHSSSVQFDAEFRCLDSSIDQTDSNFEGEPCRYKIKIHYGQLLDIVVKNFKQKEISRIFTLPLWSFPRNSLIVPIMIVLLHCWPLLVLLIF